MSALQQTPSQLCRSNLQDDVLPAASPNTDSPYADNPTPDQPFDQNGRKDQHVVVWFVNLIVTFCVGFQNILMVFNNDELSKGYISIGVLSSTILVSLFITFQLSRDFMKCFQMYLLLDNIFLMQAVSAFGFVGFLMVVYHGGWYQIITMAAFPLEIVFFVGNFRLMMLYVQWRPWQLIIYKIFLLANSTLFFEIGAYYMSQGYTYTGRKDPKLDNQVKDFVVLYIFSMFILFVAMFAKMCDFDQTTDLKFVFMFKDLSQSKKIERIRNSVIGVNYQIQLARNQFFREKQEGRASVVVEAMSEVSNQ